MKKIISFLLVFAVAFLLTGCNKKVVTTCTLHNEQTANGYTLDSTYKVVSNNGSVMKVETKEVITSEKSNVLSYFEKTLNEQYKTANDTYGGYDYKIDSSKNKVTSVVTINYDKMDLDKFVTNNPSMKPYISKGKITLKGIKALYESLGAECK